MHRVQRLLHETLAVPKQLGPRLHARICRQGGCHRRDSGSDLLADSAHWLVGLLAQQNADHLQCPLRRLCLCLLLGQHWRQLGGARRFPANHHHQKLPLRLPLGQQPAIRRLHRHSAPNIRVGWLLDLTGRLWPARWPLDQGHLRHGASDWLEPGDRRRSARILQYIRSLLPGLECAADDDARRHGVFRRRAPSLLQEEHHRRDEPHEPRKPAAAKARLDHAQQVRRLRLRWTQARHPPRSRRLAYRLRARLLHPRQGGAHERAARRHEQVHMV